MFSYMNSDIIRIDKNMFSNTRWLFRFKNGYGASVVADGYGDYETHIVRFFNENEYLAIYNHNFKYGGDYVRGDRFETIDTLKQLSKLESGTIKYNLDNCFKIKFKN